MMIDTAYKLNTVQVLRLSQLDSDETHRLITIKRGCWYVSTKEQAHNMLQEE